jgi:hypothetical protein
MREGGGTEGGGKAREEIEEKQENKGKRQEAKRKEEGSIKRSERSVREGMKEGEGRAERHKEKA